MEKFITTSSEQTKTLGFEFAKELRGGEVVCLSGDLGSGKTTFTQGLLEGLGAKGPFTSPTFAIMKVYDLQNSEIMQARHIDTYRVSSSDLIELGWKDFAGKPKIVTIVEWAEKISDLIPENAIRINFEWIEENNRKITMK